MEAKMINRTVREMLNKLIQDRKGYLWESICTYSDGKGQTFLEINIYAEQGNVQMGRIAYHLETGNLLNFRYKGYSGSHPETIIDLLLDIFNLSKKAS